MTLGNLVTILSLHFTPAAAVAQPPYLSCLMLCCLRRQDMLLLLLLLLLLALLIALNFYARQRHSRAGMTQACYCCIV